MAEFGGKRSFLKRSGVTKQWMREVELGTRLLGNDKNSSIANKLSYFLCVSFWD